MKMKKLMASLLCAAILVSSMAGCSNGAPAKTDSGKSDTAKTQSKTDAKTDTKERKTVTLKVWGSQEEQTNLTDMIEAFKVANPETTYDITFGVVAEGDAQTKYGEDPSAAADVFMFENGQTNKFVESKSLYEVTKNKDAIITANDPSSITSASVGDKLYAYPMTADNGYFLYYDKSVVSAEDAKTLDGIMAACNKANKKMFCDVSNGYYIASFFLGAGCTMSLDATGKQILDFNNEKGVAAGETIKAFTADKAFLTGDDAIFTGGLGDTIAAGISGIWNAAAVKEKLGDNFATAKLPTMTLAGKQAQMGSFAGYKLVGVNSLTKFPVEAMAVAEWLTNEENQTKRFKTREYGPSNIKAAASPEVMANGPLASLREQGAFAIPQNNVSNDYWNPAEAFGTAMENKDYSVPIKEQLDAMVAQASTAK